MRIGIIASRNFENMTAIRTLIDKINSDIGKTNVIIYSAGHSIGDEKVKKFTLQYEIEYKEFNPAYSGQNMFSYEPKKYFEGKNWHLSQEIHRYQRMFMIIDKLFVFKIKNESDKFFNMAINKIPKKLKHTIFI